MGVLSRWSCFLVKDPGTIVPTRARNGRLMEKQPRQRIHYLRTRDGVQLAWADASAGPLLVKAATWLTHLEYEWESPVWGHWLRFFCDHFRLVRYDERGCGMSDWNVGDLLTLVSPTANVVEHRRDDVLLDQSEQGEVGESADVIELQLFLGVEASDRADARQ